MRRVGAVAGIWPTPAGTPFSLPCPDLPRTLPPSLPPSPSSQVTPIHLPEAVGGKQCRSHLQLTSRQLSRETVSHACFPTPHALSCFLIILQPQPQTCSCLLFATRLPQVQLHVIAYRVSEGQRQEQQPTPHFGRPLPMLKQPTEAATSNGRGNSMRAGESNAAWGGELPSARQRSHSDADESSSQDHRQPGSSVRPAPKWHQQLSQAGGGGAARGSRVSLDDDRGSLGPWREAGSEGRLEEDLMDLSSRMIRGYMLRIARFPLFICFRLWANLAR
jgi:hypothetical protein